MDYILCNVICTEKSIKMHLDLDFVSSCISFIISFQSKALVSKEFLPSNTIPIDSCNRTLILRLKQTNKRKPNKSTEGPGLQLELHPPDRPGQQ